MSDAILRPPLPRVAGRYWQIVRTYLPRRRYFLLVFAVLMYLPFIFVALQVRHAPADEPHVLFQLLLLPQTVFLLSVMLHLKSQLLTPSAALIPNYRLPHILVAAAIALPSIPATSLFVSGLLQLPFLPALAFFALAGVLILWGFYALSPLAMFISFTLWFGLLLAPSHKQFAATLVHSSPLPPAAVIAICALFLIDLTRRLMKAHEDTPVYVWHMRLVQAQFAAARGTSPYISDSRFNSRVLQFWNAPFQHQLERLLRNPRESTGNLRRWQFATINPVGISPMAIFLVLQLFLFSLVTGSLPFNAYSAVLFAFAPALVLVYGTGAWPTFASESLRPFSRRQYIHARGMTLAILFLKLWLAFVIPLVILTSLLHRATLGDPGFWQSLAATLPALLLVYSLGTWFLRFRSILFAPAYAILSILLGTALTTSPSDIPLHVPEPLRLSATWLFPLLLSPIILLDARRRWLNTDLA